jgi:hypothetical protein
MSDITAKFAQMSGTSLESRFFHSFFPKRRARNIHFFDSLVGEEAS